MIIVKDVMIKRGNKSYLTITIRLIMIIINAHVIAAIVTVTILEMAFLYKDIRIYSPLLAINLQRDSIDNHKMCDFITSFTNSALISLFGIYNEYI